MQWWWCAHAQCAGAVSEAWRDTWSRGRVEVEGDLIVSKIAAFAQYNLLSNFPPRDPYQDPPKSEHMFGVGRGSLGRGGADNDARVWT